jgi:hypothetical protein
MSLLDGGIASIMSAALGGLYLDATLHRSSTTDDGQGGGSTTYADEAVKAQLDVATDAMRQSEGYVDTDVRILVLASGVDKPDTDCQITMLGIRYGIANVGTDPAQSYWDLHGRLA